MRYAIKYEELYFPVDGHTQYPYRSSRATFNAIVCYHCKLPGAYSIELRKNSLSRKGTVTRKDQRFTWKAGQSRTNKGGIRCYKCHARGHYANECRSAAGGRFPRDGGRFNVAGSRFGENRMQHGDGSAARC